MKNWKQKLQYGVAVVTTTALPAIAMANDSALLTAAKNELNQAKAAVDAIGPIAIGIAVSIVVVGLIIKASRKAG